MDSPSNHNNHPYRDPRNVEADFLYVHIYIYIYMILV